MWCTAKMISVKMNKGQSNFPVVQTLAHLSVGVVDYNIKNNVGHVSCMTEIHSELLLLYIDFSYRWWFSIYM